MERHLEFGHVSIVINNFAFLFRLIYKRKKRRSQKGEQSCPKTFYVITVLSVVKVLLPLRGVPTVVPSSPFLAARLSPRKVAAVLQ